jgi:hypothetical protein
VKALLQHGADVFAVTAEGSENVLHLAADLAVHKDSTSTSEMVKAIVSQANAEYATVAAAALPAATVAVAVSITVPEPIAAAAPAAPAAALAAVAVAVPSAAPAASAPVADAAATAAAAAPRRLVSQQNHNGNTPLHVLLYRCVSRWYGASPPISEQLSLLLEIDSAELPAYAGVRVQNSSSYGCGRAALRGCAAAASSVR